MGHTKDRVDEDEARETVDNLLETYNVPPEVRQQVEQYYADGEYFDALNRLINRR